MLGDAHCILIDQSITTSQSTRADRALGYTATVS